MPAMHLHKIEVPRRKWLRLRFRAFREWCFMRTIVRHMAWRAMLVGIILGGGALFFYYSDRPHPLGFVKSLFYTWCLAFGQPPEEFPQSRALQAVFFIMPALGMTVIFEAILGVAFLIRDRRRYERSWCLTMAASMSNHVILVGVGKLGFRIFRLLRRLGESVVVIEQDERCRFLDEIRRDGTPLIIGDARDERFLEEANLERARSVILATNDDLANLEIALDARRLKPGARVICRMFDENMADKVRDGFNIRLAMSQSALSAPTFTMAAIDPSIVSSFVVGNRLIVIQRWRVEAGASFAHRTVGDVMHELGCTVVELQRDGQGGRLFPPPSHKLTPGDELLLQGPYEALAQLRKQA